MNAFIITLCLIGMTCAYNPALVTSNTYPARGTNTYNPYNPYNTGSSSQQQQYYDPSSSQYSSSSNGYNTQYQTQGQQGQYQRPLYNQGMISPVNYTPNYQNRAVQIPRFARRNAQPQQQGDQMQIMPYPYQYTPQYRSQQQSANAGNSQTQQ
uniref:Uncharacterized protein n=1 Tax=Panagrellus redivivus TaxID=6233 RepID=A0A7E4VR35_PANRE